ncbi:sulfotransferase family protein [Roseibaca sp. Y0-43]|uniref:sulfotransferase family protein n=1 Tax=Roseibaca sp. Y0-43 TaxID=2816854 RepID=UPI001D0C6F90|nr:sulfotransferase [Roseibaca sp. Y0-43]
MSSPRNVQTRPLFIIGCVRSGTTLVRNLLRRQPNVICPEETHYFRYAEPFRPEQPLQLKNSPTLRKHREIDGITPENFDQMLLKSHSRGDLMRLHIQHMAQAQGLEFYKWFDKTPQNVYGIPLIRSEFPEACFLHLVRNPLNVVASLKLGKVMKVTDIYGACNYWIEAVSIIRELAPLLGSDLLEIKYEDFTTDPVASMQRLLKFSGLGDRVDLYSSRDTHIERNQFTDILNDKEKRIVLERCGALAKEYGYDLECLVS